MDININNWPAVRADIQINGVYDLIPIDGASYAFITGSDTGYRLSDDLLSTLKINGEEIPASLAAKIRRYLG
jgi:hypothetical protein